MSAPEDAIAAEGKQERSRLVARAGVVGAGTLASRVLGLVRDMALAALFDRDATDAWWVAFTIPNALRSLLGEGAVTSAVVPVLSEKLAKQGDEAARVFFARVRAASLVALVVVTAAGMLLARPLTELFATGYHDRPGEFARTVALTRVVFPYILLMGTAALGMAALNANRRFAVAAFAPGLLNVALIAAAFAAPYLVTGDPVRALAYGALAGGVLQVAAQWPALRRLGYGGRPRFVLDADVREVLRRIAPLTFGIGIYYVDLVLSRRFLSELGPGAQSYFSWAMRLCDFPQGIFVMALSTAALPSLSTLAAKGAKGELAKTWAHGMGLAMFVAIPASVAMVALGEPVVVALFQRGAFDANAAHETARALLWQGGAIWTVAAVRQTVPALYALGDTRTPVVVSALDLAAFIGLAVGLRGPMGHVGISVAVAGSSAVQMVLLLVGLRRRMGTIEGGALARSAARTLAASILAGVAGWGAARALAPEGQAGPLLRLVPGLAGMAAFGGVFGLAAWGMGATEFEDIGGALRRRLLRRRGIAGGARA
ncbi:MAG TPA: murein biosynthesis integral membrane protein MurJ, partial [Polyangiaceae bacterium]|nr:murein biosynthesis integral membrane protein MurJ [Polyangiaceae bacterium]